MTDIAFHSGVPDKLAYACRLLRKAYRSNARVVVNGPSDVLARLDKLLWVFDDLEFIPHIHARAGAAPAAHLARTPIWLADAGVEAPHREVLLHLGEEPAAGCDRFARVIEVVSTEPADREAARRRWRQYEARGHTITHHVAGAAQ
jgi:DNA polymerase III subunit chi